jgi:ComF family protein
MRSLAMRIFKRLRGMVKEAVYPARCVMCDRLYQARGSAEDPSRNGTSASPGLDDGFSHFLCDNCMQQLEYRHSPMCTCCGRPFDSENSLDHLCGRCLSDPFEFTMARSAGTYDRALKALICVFKYKRRTELALPLARLLWSTLHRYWDAGQIDLMIPVPLHRRRLRERGFNQTELMLRHWSGLARAGGPSLKEGQLALDVLIRHRHTPSQTGLDKRQRMANMAQAFRLTAADVVRGHRVLLVDDVFTTGATADACTRVLKRAGASAVDLLTLARAV